MGDQEEDLSQNHEEIIAAIQVVLDEVNRRSSGEFDGLLGSLPEGTSALVASITYYLRGYLLDKHDEQVVRAMQKKFSSGWHWANYSGADEMALGILDLIASAYNFEGERFDILLSGIDGWRGKRSNRGLVKGRKTQKDEWVMTPLTKEILEIADIDNGPKWGRIARIARVAGCSHQYAGNVLKKFRA